MDSSERSISRGQVSDRLKNRRVLIVEDDASLAKEIARLLNEYTLGASVVVHTIESALAELKASPFDLAIVDVMLPRNEADYGAIQELRSTIDKARQDINRLGASGRRDDNDTALMDARYRRAEAIQAIDELLVREGGIELVEECRKAEAAQPGVSRVKTAVLFLTAVGNDAAIKRGRKVAGRPSDWLVKPVPSEDILNVAVRLLSDSTS